MKLILGLSRPSIGYVDVNGSDPFVDWKLRKDIGFVPEYDSFYEHMTGMEYVSYFLRMHDVDGEEAEPKLLAPLLPIVLLNGAAGIATGFSTNIYPASCHSSYNYS